MPWILWYSGLCSRVLWSTVSNAFWKFTNIPKPKLCSDRVYQIISVRLIRAWVVEYFCQKPNYDKYNILLISSQLDSLLYTSFSIIFSILDNLGIDL